MKIWHHGLVAGWWAEFEHGGDDVPVFVEAARRNGGTVLDAGCGTGRLLRPLLQAGLEADGADAGPDMIDQCGRLCASDGFEPDLYVQPMHEFDTGKKYGTIIVCGAFGLGGSRADDLAGLRRLHQHLEPGGTLLLDHHLPNNDARAWRRWVEPTQFPTDWSRRADTRVAEDGAEWSLTSRQFDFDPLEQTTTLEIRCTRTLDGETQTEEGQIHINLYFKNEIELMLETAGFTDISVTTLEGGQPDPWADYRLLFTVNRG